MVTLSRATVSLNATRKERDVGRPSCFRQTDFGPLPKDWNLVRLGDVCEFQNGVNADAKSYGRGVPFVNVLEVIANTFLDVSRIPGRVEIPKATINNFRVSRGDILFNRTSEILEEVGLAAVYLDDTPVVFGGFVIRGQPLAGTFDPVYLGYALRSQLVRRQIVSKGQGAVRANIAQAELRNVRVPSPPVDEQRVIACALRDADALIASLEQLIEKKRLIKQAAMQDLLSGRRRLSGFSGGWSEGRLGDTAILKARIGWQGLTTAEYIENGEYVLVTGTEFESGRIAWDRCYFVEESRYKQDPNIQLREGDVLVTKDGTIGKVAYVESLPAPATLNSGVFVVRPKNHSFEPRFFFYLLMSGVFSDFLSKLSAGSTINHLYQKDFVNFSYKIPSTIAEQRAIADSLWDMDAELWVLESKLEKARQVKQGMMQELLTGRVRLV